MRELTYDPSSFLFVFTVEEYFSINGLLVSLWAVTLLAIGWYFVFVKFSPQRIWRMIKVLWHDLRIRKRLIQLERFRFVQEQNIQKIREHTDGTLDKLAESPGISPYLEKEIRERLDLWEITRQKHYELIDQSKRLKDELLVMRQELLLLFYVLNRIEDDPDFRLDVVRLYSLDQKIQTLFGRPVFSGFLAPLLRAWNQGKYRDLEPYE
ncbi:MAG: hypothetical protein H6562_01735 [Lewinellaceae bacterium]|nr:hypothetical protein [Lewinella sp.]MCB9277611.1 hypothetical protein [Lewinellaceae bacterium]